MRVIPKLALLALAALVPATALAAGGTSATHFRYLSVSLTGAAETPRGDPDGAGKVTVCLNLRTNVISYRFGALRNIGAPTAAHIHQGAPGTAGPVIIPFSAPPKSGAWAGTITTTETAIAAIAANPRQYYVNVHTRAFAGGAVRGQLRAFHVAPHRAMLQTPCSR